jgi:hypothetical protein
MLQLRFFAALRMTSKKSFSTAWEALTFGLNIVKETSVVRRGIP